MPAPKCPLCGSNMNQYLADLGQAAQTAVKCTRCQYHQLYPTYERDMKKSRAMMKDIEAMRELLE